MPKKVDRCVATWERGDCDRTDIAGDGLCFSHYQQRRRNTPLRPIRFYRPPNLEGKALAEWCVEHGAILNESGHRLWRFACSPYPVLRLPTKQIRVHRLVAAYLVVGRTLQSNDVVHHKCAIKQCINPGCLQVTTAQANTAESYEKRALLQRIVELESEVATLRSNMSKLSADGKAILREDGKVLKGPNYQPPNIAAVLGL